MDRMATTSLENKDYGDNFRTLEYLTRKHASAVMDKDCDQAHMYPAFWVFHSALIREYELSIMAINEYMVRAQTDPAQGEKMRLPGLPYWNWFIDMQSHDGIAESSLWSYFGSYYGDPANKYQTVGGEFAHWKVPTVDSVMEMEKDLLEDRRITKDEIINDYAFGAFNGYGYLRAPYSTTDAPRITRNPGRLANAPIRWNTPLDDILKCTSSETKTYLDWDLCLNRLANGLHLVPHAFAGSFNDSDTSYAPVAPIVVAIFFFVIFLFCCPLKRLIFGKPKDLAVDGSIIWTGLFLITVTMISTTTFHTSELVANASPAIVVALIANM